MQPWCNLPRVRSGDLESGLFGDREPHMPGANFGAVRSSNPGAGSKLHISPILVASILLFGGV
jgi:hypothetical protein